ncbi:hypothetical protein [Streptomyces sp. NPDC018000]|uniref:hypothetical protein n=1 Tax=Streptomyces sp. NPDC018000 TaxID=3365028 RepID=UPI0037AD5ED6
MRAQAGYDVFDAVAYIRAVQARDVDTACAVAQQCGPEPRGLLLDVAERVILPVTALDGQAKEPRADSFALEALGRILAGALRADDDGCPAQVVVISRTIIRFTAEALTEDGQDVAEVLAQLEAAGVEQSVAACGPSHGTTVYTRRPPCRGRGKRRD